MRTLEERAPASALIVGAGYIGLEMAEALTARGLSVTQMEQLPEVLPTVDPELGSLVHAELVRHGVEVLTGTAVTRIAESRARGRSRRGGQPRTVAVAALVDMVLVVVGVRPDSELAAAAGAALGAKGAIAVDRQMRTNLPDVFAAGDCVVTHTDCSASVPAARDDRTQAGPDRRRERARRRPRVRRQPRHAGRQDLRPVAARTGLRDHEAKAAGFDPLTVESEADDHKAYYPGSHRSRSASPATEQPAGCSASSSFGHRHAEIAKRIDIAATAISTA